MRAYVRAFVRACLRACLCVIFSRVETKDNLFCQYLKIVFLKSCHTWGQGVYGQVGLRFTFELLFFVSVRQ